jgi:hypothetical protein
MARQYNNQGIIRLYLLGQLTDEEKRQEIEQRLLSDQEFFEELEVAEEELIDDYLAGQLTEDERGRFEQYFHANPERRQKLRFARSLNRYVRTVGSRQNIRAPFWSHFLGTKNWVLPAATIAVIVIVASIFLFSRQRTPSTIATLTLTISATTRGEGTQATKVTLPLNADVLRLRLKLPETSNPARRYRVELLRENGETETLPTAGQDGQSVVVEIPAAHLSRGQYALNVFVAKPNGTNERINGSYYFTVEQ